MWIFDLGMASEESVTDDFATLELRVFKRFGV
jgi:hypothetical protein